MLRKESNGYRVKGSMGKVGFISGKYLRINSYLKTIQQ
jgi:hypothetical protein